LTCVIKEVEDIDEGLRDDEDDEIVEDGKDLQGLFCCLEVETACIDVSQVVEPESEVHEESWPKIIQNATKVTKMREL
jgi:hypothetical protein